MPATLATRRYNRAVLLLSVAYGVTLVAAVYLFRHHLVAGATAWIAAILPALSIVGIFAAIGRYLIEERDEYLRMLTVRQTLFASGFAVTIATMWGFLESFGLVGHIEAFYIAVVWFAGLGLGALVNRATIGRAA